MPSKMPTVSQMRPVLATACRGLLAFIVMAACMGTVVSELAAESPSGPETAYPIYQDPAADPFGDQSSPPATPAIQYALPGQPPPDIATPPFDEPIGPPLLPAPTSKFHNLLDSLDGSFVARGYFIDDQRVNWSGMEETFGSEAAIAPRLSQRCGDWAITIDSEFYLNQPFDRNALMNTAERRSYAGHFQVDTFEISKLSISVACDDFTIVMGKMETPFGRTYFPLYSNARIDAPFIRTESILWRETGLLLRYKHDLFVGDVAIVNGSENLDTNSTKALMARLGLEDDFWAIGCSGKVQDGIGSENQKEFKNHFGFDMMVRSAPFVLSAEVIYDEYGFHEPGFDPNNITWNRSIYYRDESSGTEAPLSGIGYYVDLGFRQDAWTIDLNYGEFFPEKTGTAPNQYMNRRGIIKVAYNFAKSLQFYSVTMIENGGYTAQDGFPRTGLVLLDGLQYTF